MVAAEPDEKENCSICLGEVENRGRISCDHKFCFECIHNWSKVTNICPICKKAFKKITAVADSTEKKRGEKRKGPPKEMKVIYTPIQVQVVATELKSAFTLCLLLSICYSYFMHTFFWRFAWWILLALGYVIISIVDFFWILFTCIESNALLIYPSTENHFDVLHCFVSYCIELSCIVLKIRLYVYEKYAIRW